MSMNITQVFQDTVNKVNLWAVKHAPVDFSYGSRQSYWALALQEKIITKHEYDYAAAWYGTMWTYRGD